MLLLTIVFIDVMSNRFLNFDFDLAFRNVLSWTTGWLGLLARKLAALDFDLGHVDAFPTLTGLVDACVRSVARRKLMKENFVLLW